MLDRYRLQHKYARLLETRGRGGGRGAGSGRTAGLRGGAFESTRGGCKKVSARLNAAAAAVHVGLVCTGLLNFSALRTHRRRESIQTERLI